MTTFRLLKCPCCENITKKLEKVTFVKDIIYEKVRLTLNNCETIAERDIMSDNQVITRTFYRCLECGFETEDLTTFNTGEKYEIGPHPKNDLGKGI